MKFEITIPHPTIDNVPASTDEQSNDVAPSDRGYFVKFPLGSSTIFVGANGSGKSRLAIHLETHFAKDAHRISAHRSLSLDPRLHKIDENTALETLRFGSANAKQHFGTEEKSRVIKRWKQKQATALLDDFGPLIQVLFADQANISLETHKKAHDGTLDKPKKTQFQTLIDIWERVLPGRQLIVSGDDIKVSPADGSPSYSAEEMSDGERAIFYMIGQALVAAEKSLLIFDEPELHVHRAILSRVWDELEAARPDCAFVLITHDLDFASSRPGNKYVLTSYSKEYGWDLQSIPEDSGFSEELTTLILGSRKPILFVEGNRRSLDLAIYRACYSEWTIIPCGSCQDVIRSVVSLRAHEQLTRITCSGIVDADDYDDEERAMLGKLGIEVLPVSEIENIFLLPSISEEILKAESHSAEQRAERMQLLESEVFEKASTATVLSDVVMRHCRRRIDRALKKIDFSESKTPEELESHYKMATSGLDVLSLAADTEESLRNFINDRDLESLLSRLDRKDILLSLAAKHLKATKKDSFVSWLTRAIGDSGNVGIKDALITTLPVISSR